MTALPEFQRLECRAIWRETLTAQRRDVIVSFGDATLVISDERAAKPLAHWSLAALIRLNPGKLPARYAPSQLDEVAAQVGRNSELPADEELEMDDDTMIGAIEKLQSRIEARRPHPGRLRSKFGVGSAAFFALLAVVWLPGATTRHVADVAPTSKRIEIGRMALKDITTVTGQPCHTAQGDAALERLTQRLKGAREIAVLPEGLNGVRRLPGQVIAVGLPLLVAQDTPEVVAGHIIAAELATEKADPLVTLLEWAGFGAAIELLTTGELPPEKLAGYGEHLLQIARPDTRDTSHDEALLSEFAKVGVSSTPYAYSLDSTGETVLGLIEADPFKGAPAPEPVMVDSDWIALQTICDG
jgi:hypothetical protein